jgi:hypothetical protein
MRSVVLSNTSPGRPYEMLLVRAELSWCDDFRLLDVWRPSAVCNSPASSYEWPTEMCHFRTPEEEPEDHSDQHMIPEVDNCELFWTARLGKAECLRSMCRKITARGSAGKTVTVTSLGIR